jgi:NAD-dependent SIR2 family protein deacetylase
MNTGSFPDKHCPMCGAEIPRGAVLIEYESEMGRTTYADCPGCGDVVRPE